MSYIQIEIGGKLRGLKFNVLAIKEFHKKVDYARFEDTANYALVYGGLVANCYVKGENEDFTYEEVCDWVDELSKEVMESIDKKFSESQAYKKLIPETEKETEVDKKKVKSITPTV